MECLLDYEGALDDERSVVMRIADMIHVGGPGLRGTRVVNEVLSPTDQLVKELLMIEDANDRWDIIMNVWMEMLCYMALHCEAAFHAQRLSTGGEFLTHVNVLIYDLGLPYSTYFSEADEESHQTHACIYSSDEQLNSE